jgi:hypothetical protein
MIFDLLVAFAHISAGLTTVNCCRKFTFSNSISRSREFNDVALEAKMGSNDLSDLSAGAPMAKADQRGWR